MLEQVVLFFLLGLGAGLVGSDLKLPAALYERLSIFLLLAIGLKGGVELGHYPLLDLVAPSLVVVAMGATIPLLLFPVPRGAGRLARADAAPIALEHEFATNKTAVAAGHRRVPGQRVVGHAAGAGATGGGLMRPPQSGRARQRRSSSAMP